MIRKFSKTRAQQNQQYLKAREKYLKEHPACERCGTSETLQIHHKKGRVGQLLINPKYFMTVCFMCHDKIEHDPLWAKANGYSLSRLAI